MSADAIRRILAALPKPQNREHAASAHWFAAAFHTAMTSMIGATHDMEDASRELLTDPDSASWQSTYFRAEAIHQNSLDQAAVALAQMPATWVAALEVVLCAQADRVQQ